MGQAAERSCHTGHCQIRDDVACSRAATTVTLCCGNLAAARKPIWHARLSGNFAVAPSTDRSLLAVLDDKALMILKTETAEIQGSKLRSNSMPTLRGHDLPGAPAASGLLLSYTTEVRVLDTEKGESVSQVFGFRAGRWHPTR